MNTNTVEKKLRKWRDCKIVVPKGYTKPPAAKIYYRIGKEGGIVLEKIGQIQDESEVNSEDLSARRNFDHYFAIRDVVLLTMINLKKFKRNVSSLPPSEIPYYEIGMEGTSPVVVPDWVLTSEYGFLNIELDTGTENLTRLKEKIAKYVKYASQRSNEIHHVLIVVIDGNDEALKYSNEIAKDRSGRISNLKEAIICSNAHVYSNLNFYVVTMSRAGEVGFKVLTGEYPYPADKRSNEINATLSLLELNHSFGYELEWLMDDDFYLADVNCTLYADGHYFFKGHTEQKSEVVLMKLMEEGSVKCLDQITYLNLLQTEKRFKRHVDKIIAIYRNNKELENDVFGKVLSHIHFCSSEQLGYNFEKLPMFYQTVNTSRMEGVLLYEE